MMGIAFYLAVGFVGGFLAWAATPSRERMHPVVAVAIALVGSFMGGIFLELVVDERLFAMHRCGIVGSVAGATCLLFTACSIFRDNVRHVETEPDATLRHRRIMPDAADRPNRAIAPQIPPLYLAR